MPVKSLKVTLEPIQDLHGYDKPWTGGAGKQLIPITESAMYTRNGITADVGTDGVISFSGASADAFSLTFAEFKLPAGSYAFSGYDSTCVSDGGTTYAYIRDLDNSATLATINLNATANRYTFTISAETNVRFYMVCSDANISLSGALKCLLCVASNTDTAYEPYSNICPISGHTECVTEVCGVNVWDEEWEVGGISNDTGEMISSSNSIRSKNFIPVVPQTSYYIAGLSSGMLRPMFYDADKNFIGAGYWAGGTSNNPQSTPSGCYYMKFKLTASYGATYNHDISINYPSTDHAYHAYNGHTYTTTLGRTVYGGTLDVVSGELVVDRAMVTTNGSESGWTLYQASDATNVFRYTNAVVDSVSEQNQISSQFAHDASAWSASATRANTFVLGGSRSLFVQTTNELASDIEAFKAYLANNPLQVCYPLATPQTYQLDPQTISLLKGNNNVWSDGEVELTYNADVGLYIDKKLGTSGTSTLSMTRTLDTKSEETKTDAELTKSDNIQLAED